MTRTWNRIEKDAVMARLDRLARVNVNNARNARNARERDDEIADVIVYIDEA